MGQNDERVPADAIRRWVLDVVVGLNLCPFARRVYEGGLIRYVVSRATDGDSLLAALGGELRTLVAAPRTEIETTLLIHPWALADYLDYNDFLSDAERLLRDLGLRGVVQVAGFHPDYQFAGTAPEAVENYTNRSPHPMLHLLREESVTEVAGDLTAMAAIPQRNIETLNSLGRAAMRARLKAVTEGTI